MKHDYESAVTKRAEMIAAVGFWFVIVGAKRPSDDEIWEAWGAVLAERGTANSLDVCRHLTK